jgi:hypothetical protein
MNIQTRKTYSSYLAKLGRSRSANAQARTARTNDDVFTDGFFIVGMIALALQSVQIGMAQPAHVWMLLALGIGVLRGKISLTGRDAFFFFLFIATMLAATFFQGFGRVKAGEQLLKYCLIYPGFYCVGRWFGVSYSNRKFPIGYVFLAAMLAVQYVIQDLKIPHLYVELDFAEGALHGSFKERNWLAIYFLLFSYAIFLKSRTTPALILFLAINAAAAYFSGSKTAFLACGLIFLIHGRTAIPLKILFLIIGGSIYWWMFSSAFSADEIQLRLEAERGLALTYASDLLEGNIFGYGVGFLEYYFTYVAGYVQGLGEGTNALFCTPLDLMIIAGFAGLAAWFYFFAGFGLGATSLLLPIAALSFINPLHGSEYVYMFLGILSAFAKNMERKSYANVET